MQSFPDRFRALVIGASGGIGQALVQALQANPRCGAVVALSRQSVPRIDFDDEASVAVAAVIAAGLDGIANNMDPGAPRNVNLYEWSEAQLKEAGIGLLPQNLNAALDALEADSVIREALGPVTGEFLKFKRMEWIEYMRHVSEWEVKQYLEFF